MGSDQRPVTTDALETLGTIITANERRDAIHLAVENVVAACQLIPGEHVGLLPDGRASSALKQKLGIVDPFLDNLVKPGERFWLVVYPRKINSLRHVWNAPGFPLSELDTLPTRTPSIEHSEGWMRDFCNTNDMPSYDVLMELLKTGKAEDGEVWLSHDDSFITVHGTDAHCDLPPKFWVHAENLTGKTFESKPDYFGCSC